MTGDSGHASAPVSGIHNKRSLYGALGGTLFLRIGGGVMGILTGLFLAAKNGESDTIHITAVLVGIVTASFFITELGGSFVAGGLIDHHGPRRYMILGPLFGAAAMLITGFLNPGDTPLQFMAFLLMLVVARLLEGSAAAAANPASLALIAVYTSDDPKLRSKISGYFELATLLGGIIGFIIGGRLWDAFGQNAFLLNIAFYLASAVIFFTVDSVKPHESAESQSHNLKSYAGLVAKPRLRELVPAWLCVSALLGVLFNHATFQLSRMHPRRAEDGLGGALPFPGQTLSHAFNGSQVGYVFGLYAVAFGVGIFVWSLIMPRMRKSTALLISTFGIIAASIVIFLINHTGPIEEPSTLRLVLIPLMIIMVMIESGFTPAALIYLSDMSELYPAQRGMVMGLYSFLFGFGQLAGSILAGPFADWQGIDGLLLFMVILAVLGIFSVLLLRRDEQIAHEGLRATATAPAAGR